MVSRDGILQGFRGHVDAVEPVLSGWVAEIERPSAPVSFFVSIDRSHRISVIADRRREDVAAAGLAGPDCGFSVDLPPGFLDGAEHDLALLLPDGRSLNLPGSPPSVALGPARADLIPASAANVDAVAALLRRNDVEAGFDGNLIGPEHAAAFNTITPHEQGFVFYAGVGARLVGYARLDRGHGDASALGVIALTVLEAYRRKGIGEALLRALLRAAAQEGACAKYGCRCGRTTLRRFASTRSSASFATRAILRGAGRSLAKSPWSGCNAGNKIAILTWHPGSQTSRE